MVTNNLNFKPENLCMATCRGVVTNSIHSQVFYLRITWVNLKGELFQNLAIFAGANPNTVLKLEIIVVKTMFLNVLLIEKE